MFSCSYQQIKVGALEEARDDPVANYFLSSSDRLRQKHISSDTRVVSGLRFNPPPWIRYGEKTSTSSARGFGRIRCSGFFADYIYTLDDGTQGSNNIGLRPTQWEVLDEHSPGTPGTPNGRLEFGGTTSEIEFAVSIEAHPTLLIP